MLSRGLYQENPKVNAGGKRRGATTAAVVEDAPPSTARGRGRGAKRSVVYAGLSAYNSHFTDLISMELKHEKVTKISKLYHAVLSSATLFYTMLDCTPLH